MNFSVAVLQISLFILLAKRKSPNKNSDKRSFVLHGALMDKQSLLVVSEVSSPSEVEIWTKSMK